MNKKAHVIVAAALKYEDGMIVVGVRHFDHFMIQVLKLYDPDMSKPHPIQGFVDNRQEFLTREEALEIALEQDQIIIKHNPKAELFSDDMY